MINTQAERQRLRRHYLAKRDLLSCADRAAMSGRIVKRLVALPIFKEKSQLFIYCNYQSEVATSELLKRCLREGKSVSVPKTVPQRFELQAVTITNPSADLAAGYKGIPEPIPPFSEFRMVPPQSIEMVILPGAVFDRAGHRLGYGGGYYDRFLANEAPQAYRIGLAFSLQLVNRIPTFPHDIPLDMLITEQEVLVWPRSCEENSRL